MKLTVKISDGNTKLGPLPNLSLAPGRSCSAEACRTCCCYACRAYRQYKGTRAAWDANTDLALNDLPTMEKDLMTYFGHLSAPRFFRLHVGGDFISRDYAAMWARVAAANPGTNFLAFTKQWEMIRDIDFSQNFSLVLSAWPGTEIPADLAAKYSVAWVDDGTTKIPDTAMECPGNCDTCGACWGLARMGIDVKFRKH